MLVRHAESCQAVLAGDQLTAVENPQVRQLGRSGTKRWPSLYGAHGSSHSKAVPRSNFWAGERLQAGFAQNSGRRIYGKDKSMDQSTDRVRR